VGGFLGNGIGYALTKLTGVLGFSIINGNIYTITETIVLGHTGYTTLGMTLGYGYFSFSGQLSDAQIWSMNMQYLSDCGKLGANFIIEATRPLAHPVWECGSWLYLEIQYLLEQGYQWLEDLSALIR
jgi:hypothetical protein